MRSRTLSIVAAAVLALPLVACQVRQTQEGQMPKVKVEGGQVPKYEVKTPTVEMGTTPTEVTVPKVDVGTQKKTLQMPHVEIKPAATPTPAP